MQYIIEYVAGSKGDLLTRFLNNSGESFSTRENNKTDPLDFGGPNWLKLLNDNDLTLDRFEDVLSRNKQKYISAHPIWQISTDQKYRDVLAKLNYQVIKVKFSLHHYVTIRIESLFKNLFPLDLNDPDYLVKRLNRIYFDKKEPIDFNPQVHLDNLLNQDLYKSRQNYNDRFLLPLNDSYRIIMLYDDLYVNFTLDQYEQFQNLNLERWKELVNQSWVPFNASVGGKQYDLAKLGYRDFRVDKA